MFFSFFFFGSLPLLGYVIIPSVHPEPTNDELFYARLHYYRRRPLVVVVLVESVLTSLLYSRNSCGRRAKVMVDVFLLEFLVVNLLAPFHPCRPLWVAPHEIIVPVSPSVRTFFNTFETVKIQLTLEGRQLRVPEVDGEDFGGEAGGVDDGEG